MKAILISTRPQWVAAILNGIKKSEIRKGTALYKAINALIREQGTAPVLLYCTKDSRHLVAPFNFREGWFYKEYNDNTCYANGCTRNMGDDINGKVVAQFNATAEEIKIHFLNKQLTYRVASRCEYTTKSLSNSQLKKSSCLSNDEMNNYFKYVYDKNVVGTAIHVNDLKIFDKPKEIRDFSVYSHKVDGIGYNGEEKTFRIFKPLTRAPQNYCYIEV